MGSPPLIILSTCNSFKDSSVSIRIFSYNYSNPYKTIVSTPSDIISLAASLRNSIDSPPHTTPTILSYSLNFFASCKNFKFLLIALFSLFLPPINKHSAKGSHFQISPIIFIHG